MPGHFGRSHSHGDKTKKGSDKGHSRFSSGSGYYGGTTKTKTTSQDTDDKKVAYQLSTKGKANAKKAATISKRNKIMYNTVLDFNGTEKHTKGSVTYFTAKIRDANKDVKFSDVDKTNLKNFLEYVKQENDYVKSEYDKAKKNQVTAEDVLDDEIMKEMTA